MIKKFFDRYYAIKYAVLRSRITIELHKRFLRLIGSAHYDLPLNKSADSQFLILLVSLMSFLAILAFAGSFALSSMTHRWTSGLENKVTIEIPAETTEGHLLSQDTVKKETKKIQKSLESFAVVRESHILDEKEISELISPWIGDDLDSLSDIPLPGLISVELALATPEAIVSLEKHINETSTYAVLERHQEWLMDLLHFSKTLQVLASIIAIVIGAATITAIAGAIKTRMTIYKEEVELLHLMGATDNYIARQFQRHAIIFTFKGTLIGTIAGLVTTLALIIASGQSNTALIPVIKLDFMAYFYLLVIPLLIIFISALTARITVLQTLGKMA